MDGNTLVLNVVNRHKDQAIDARSSSRTRRSRAAARVSRRSTGPDIKAENDFGKTEVSTQSRTAKAQGKTVQHRFPAHSFTQLTARIA